jgi:hypothetical protein
MIPGVLLHVIPAPGPVDFAVNFFSDAKGRVRFMPHHPVFHFHINNARRVQPPRIKGLTPEVG